MTEQTQTTPPQAAAWELIGTTPGWVYYMASLPGAVTLIVQQYNGTAWEYLIKVGDHIAARGLDLPTIDDATRGALSEAANLAHKMTQAVVALASGDWPQPA